MRNSLNGDLKNQMICKNQISILRPTTAIFLPENRNYINYID
jgi:hypothetical protein